MRVHVVMLLLLFSRRAGGVCDARARRDAVWSCAGVAARAEGAWPASWAYLGSCGFALRDVVSDETRRLRILTVNL